MMPARYGLLAALAAFALAATTATATAAPYTLSAPGVGELELEASGSTLAVEIDRDGDFVDFVPGTASTMPFGCFGGIATVRCFAFAVTQKLTLEGETLEADVDGVVTNLLTLTGGAGSDRMTVAGPGPLESGVIGTVALAPGLGNDGVTVGGRVGALSVTGSGDGDDRFDITSTAIAPVTLNLGDGNDVASSLSPGVKLEGAAGNDTLSGAGALDGGAGSDVLQPTVLGTIIAGGDGAFDIDRLSYRLLGAAVMVTRPAATDVKVATDATTKTGIDQVEGSPFADSLTGHSGPDVFFGAGGDDLLDGRGGGDILDGGPGFNTVTYEAGPSPVNVNLATATATAGGVVDTLASIHGVIAGPGNDVVTGGSADETITLGAGDDQVDGGDGNDTLVAGDGQDTLRGGDGNDVLDGGPGADVATYDERTASEPVTVNLGAGAGGAAGESDALSAIEDVTGGASSDTLTGDDGPNTLRGGPGLNTLDGLGGDDVIRGGEARDVILGGKGRDQLFGEGDDDSINAFDGEADMVSCGASLDDDAQVDAVDQVDGCEFASRGDVPVPVDADGDGFVGGFDCNDANGAISPAAVDIPADKIDQNCDGFDEAIPFVDYAVTLSLSRANPRGRIVTKLIVTKLPADHRVRVLCKPPRRVARRCPFSSAIRKPSARTRQVVLTPLFKRRRLPAGTVIEMQITAPKFNGRVRRITLRNGPFREQRLCLIAPSKTPRRCPSGEEE